MRILLVCAICLLLLGRVAPAQALFEVTPSGIEDVQLIRATDYTAAELLSNLPQSSTPFAQSALPYSVVVRNTGPVKIVNYTVVFRSEGNSRMGGMAATVNFIGTDRSLAPGGFDLVAPTGIVDTGSDARAATNLSRISMLADSRRVVATLDSVIYEDGKFVGPDLWGTFNTLAARQIAVARMVGEIQAMTASTNEEVIARLQQIVHENQVPGAREDRNVFLAKASTGLAALTYLTCLQAGGKLQVCGETASRTLPSEGFKVWR